MMKSFPPVVRYAIRGIWIVGGAYACVYGAVRGLPLFSAVGAMHLAMGLVL